MKTNRFFLLILLFGALFVGCSQRTTAEDQPSDQPAEKKPDLPKSSPTPITPLFDAVDSVDQEERIPADFEGNYVWAATMNLAWRELIDSILHGPVMLNVKSGAGKEMLRKFNSSEFSKKDLDSKSYYVKSGYGPETVERINLEVQSKFPKGKIPALQVQLEKTHFINYAVYRKDMKYWQHFSAMDVKFNGKKVKGFGGDKEAIAETIRILLYESDEKFILQLNVNDFDDRIYLAKGFSMKSPAQVLSAIPRKDPANMGRTTFEDSFEAPIIRFKLERSYDALEHVRYQNPGFEQYEIVAMQEAIDFQMDQYGARVTSVAVQASADSAGTAPPVPKKLLLNKPYWVIMKRKDSPRPYFILGVRNTAMMKTAD